MPQDAGHLIWIDLEMTGLKPDSDRIIEVALVVTDSELNTVAEAPVWAVHQDDAVLDAMDAHDVGRGRGGVAAALRALPGALYAVGVPGDQLYSAETVRQWAELGGAAYRELRSHCGHDAFLVETAPVGYLLTQFLKR